MNTFSSLQDLFTYIPNCLICNKEMYIAIHGWLNIKIDHITFLFDKHLMFGKKEEVYWKSSIKDNICYFKHKKYPFAIDLSNNKIIQGVDIINHLTVNWMYISKKCRTCNFLINTIYRSGNTKKILYFPEVQLVSEYIRYTLPHHRNIVISKSYYDASTMLGERTNISIEGLPVKEFPINFARFKNLDQLNHRISTILVFQ